jgi:amphiphysin
VQSHRALAPPAAGSLIRSTSTASGSSGGSRPGVSRTTSTASAFQKKAPPPPPGASLGRSTTSASAAAPPPYTAGGAGAGLAAAASTKRAPPPPPPLKPKPAAAPAVQYVVALYDFVAQADGDLSFSAGDRIEIVERTASAEDWWTGRLDGAQGVFPGAWPQTVRCAHVLIVLSFRRQLRAGHVNAARRCMIGWGDLRMYGSIIYFFFVFF